MPPTSSPNVSKTEVSPQKKLLHMPNDSPTAKEYNNDSVKMNDDSDKCHNDTQGNNNREQNEIQDPKNFNQIMDGQIFNSPKKLEEENLDKSISNFKSSLLRNSILSSSHLSSHLRRMPKNITTHELSSKTDNSHEEVDANNDS